jgi:hypothetical protein
VVRLSLLSILPCGVTVRDGFDTGLTLVQTIANGQMDLIRLQQQLDDEVGA